MSDEYKDKGAAESVEQATSKDEASQAPAKAPTQNDGQNETQVKDQEYNWCACPVDVADRSKGIYYARKDTGESSWEEPNEPYWTGYDPVMQTWAELFDPSKKAEDKPVESTADSNDSAYQGYNPKIHGSYDPTAPYAKWHEAKHKAEDVRSPGPSSVDLGDPSYGAPYASVGNFNRFTGAFQTGDQSAERHSGDAKSGRQMNAYFDVDEAANAHGGRSLKAERQNKKLSKKELAEMKARRAEKKRRKRTEWLKS